MSDFTGLAAPRQIVNLKVKTRNCLGAARPQQILALQGLSPIGPARLFGQLEDLLLHGVRVRHCEWMDAAGSAGSDCDPQFFVATISEVAANVLEKAYANPYVSPAQPGFRAAGAHIHVSFEADMQQPLGPAHELRAKDIRLVPEQDSEESASDPHLALTAIPPQETAVAQPLHLQALVPAFAEVSDLHSASSFVLLAASEWRSFGDASMLRAAIDALEAEVAIATEECSGERLCTALLRGAAGLSRPGSSLWCSRGVSTSAKESEGWEKQEWRLRGLVVECLERLDLRCKGVFARVRQALKHLQAFLPEAEDPADGDRVCDLRVGRLQWRRLVGLVRSVTVVCPGGRFALRLPFPRREAFRQDSLRICSAFACCQVGHRARLMDGSLGGECLCPRHGSRGPCSVRNCTTKAAGIVWQADAFGCPGLRCAKHGARWCDVAGCTSMSICSVPYDDGFGPAGRRCYRHSSEQLKSGLMCNVPGCGRRKRKYLRLADNFGPPGFRCDRHGGRPKRVCTADNCGSLHAWGEVRFHDHLGPPGGRCHKHGGWTCNVAGCTRVPMRKIAIGDCFGPPGIRCRQHNLQKNAEILEANKLARRRRAIEKYAALVAEGVKLRGKALGLWRLAGGKPSATAAGES